jgi:nitroimidazol reductase NimA-like FMN-containing flavoprotein (pyridoxamine 5'-phosphate oxidase superfamily)
MKKPTFRAMTQRESLALLRRQHVGRIAFTFKDRVDIEPIGYVLSGGWLYGRTSRGQKLIQLKHNPWVAFEVDEIDGPFDWRSVVVHGTVYFLNPEGEEHPDFGRAVRLFKKLDPRTLAASDPAPDRTIFFRIHVDRLSGRVATTKTPRRPTSRRRAG